MDENEIKWYVIGSVTRGRELRIRDELRRDAHECFVPLRYEVKELKGKRLRILVPAIKGYIFAAIAAASYGTNPIFAIPLNHEGISVSSVLFMRYAMAVAIMFVFTMIKSPKSLIIKPKHIGVLAFMGILMVLSSIGLFASYKYLSAGIASTLLFLYPVMVAVIMAIFYKERLTKKSWACLVTAFIGVVILSKDDRGSDATDCCSSDGHPSPLSR